MTPKSDLPGLKPTDETYAKWLRAAAKDFNRAYAACEASGLSCGVYIGTGSQEAMLWTPSVNVKYIQRTNRIKL